MSKISPITSFIRENVVKVVKVKQHTFLDGSTITKSNFLNNEGKLVADMVYKHTAAFSQINLRTFRKDKKIPQLLREVNISREFADNSKRVLKNICTEVFDTNLITGEYKKLITISKPDMPLQYIKKALANIYGKIIK